MGYLPRRPRALLPLCAVNRAWRDAATRDEAWEDICRQAVGGKPLLDRILGSKSGRGGFHGFFVQRRRALASYQPTLRSRRRHHEAATTAPSFTEPPPAGFFDRFLWVLELRDGADPERHLLYSCVLDMKDPQARGKIFTSAGAAVVGQGIRLGVDVKARLAPASTPSPRSPSSAACATPAAGDGGHGEEKDAGPGDDNDCPHRTGATAAAEPPEPPELVFRLWVYDRRAQRAACFVAARLEPPGRWHGRRHYDGPFSGPGGGPTTRIVLDEEHSLRVQPTVEMVDQFDSRVYLMAVRVDLQLCQCQGDEPVAAHAHAPAAAFAGCCGDWDLPMWAAAAGGGCHCVPGSGLGMIPEEGTWILLHDLLTTKLRWC